eukprot:2984521-Alexandrium_andersonii.AAC.1
MEPSVLERNGDQALETVAEGFGAERAALVVCSPVHVCASDVAGGTRPGTLDLLQSIQELPHLPGDDGGSHPILEEPA